MAITGKHVVCTGFLASVRMHPGGLGFWQLVCQGDARRNEQSDSSLLHFIHIHILLLSPRSAQPDKLLGQSTIVVAGTSTLLSSLLS